MATHFEDEEQLERIKTWWKENWIALVGGLAIGFGSIGGWEAYKHWRDGRGETASHLYETLRKALGEARTEEARQIADRLSGDYDDTPYAAAAALVLAQDAVHGKQLDEAVTRLDWVIAHADDAGMQQVAKLRKGRVLLAQGKHDAALAALDGEPGGFASLYEELRGDIQFARGDRAAARAAYEKALAAAEPDAVNRRLLQQKLDDLAAAS